MSTLPRRAAVCLLLSAGFVAAACGVGEGGGGGQAAAGAGGGEFCRTAMARVDSFMATVPDTFTGDRYGGTAVVGGIGELVDGMNSVTSTDFGAQQNQNFVNLMTLVHYDEKLNPVPYLAKSWDVSKDDTELTFHLRDDVRWHDGVPTSAYDVRFTYLRATDPSTGFPNAAYWTYYVKGDSGVEVLDSTTVRFHMKPHAEFLDPWRATAILPEHLLGDVPPAQLRQHPYGTVCPVGNGPFVFAEHRQDESWTFVANPDFPAELGGRPYLDRYVYRIIPEQTTLLTDLLTGGVDVDLGVAPDAADRVENADQVRLVTYPTRQYNFVGWNARIPQLQQAAVRRAITYATDRKEMVDAIVKGYGRVANTSVPPFHWAYDPAFDSVMPYDPARARQLLDSAGWKDRDGDGVRENADGVPLELTVKYNTGNQQRQQIAEIMQSQLRKVGIEIHPQSLEWATLVSQMTNTETRPIQGIVMGWVTDFALNDRDLFDSDAADDPYGFAGLKVPAVDRLLDTLQLVPSRKQAIPLWRDYQKLIIRYQPYTFLYFPEALTGVSRRIHDVKMDVRGYMIDTDRWWIPADQRKYQGSR